MSYALRRPEGPLELQPGLPIVSGGIQFSFETMLLWSDAARAAHGILPIAEPGPAPAGKVVINSALADDGQTIRRVLTLADASDPVPASVTNYQARTALRAAGLRDKVDAALRGSDQTLAVNADALDAWEYANNFFRDQAFIVALGPSFGLRPADIDDLFRAAAKVV